MMNTSKINLLFLHGFPFGPSLWRRQRTALEARGYRTAAPDLRIESSPATMDMMADEAIAALDAAGMTQAMAIGFSMGGYVAFSLLARYPERVSGLVLVDTRAEADSEEGKAGRRRLADIVLKQGAGAAAESLIDKLLAPTTLRNRPEVAQEADKLMREASPAAVAAAALGMAEREDRTGMLPDIRVPTLVIVGEDDAITPVSVARGMAEAIPKAGLRVISGAGHLTMLEQPEEFESALVGWLDESGGRS